MPDNAEAIGPFDEPADLGSLMDAAGLGRAGTERDVAASPDAFVPTPPPVVRAPGVTAPIAVPPETRVIPPIPGSVGWLFFGREGRIGRATYIVAILMSVAALVAVAPLLAVAGKTGDGGLIPPEIVLPAFGTALWTIAAVSIKRWHDTARSGWWALTALVPVVGLVAPALVPSYPGATEFGGAPRTTDSPRRRAIAVAVVAALAVVFAAGLRFYSREPAQGQLASAAQVDASSVTPSVTTDLPGHFIAAYLPFVRTALIVANLRNTSSPPTSEVYADAKLLSDALRTFSYRVLALKAGPVTEGDIRQLVAANNRFIAALPNYELRPWDTASLTALESSAVASASASGRVRADLGITTQQLQQALAQAPVT
jgi:uncharacterized membrane protein YhaH (DUF805 family)